MSSPRPINRSRQRRDPPSCQMCRVKKLKCDRQRPCSNCRTRRLSCNYSRELATTAIPVAGHSDGDLKAQNDALQARVSRLEKAVFGEGAAEASTTRRDLRTKSSSRSEQEALHHSIPRTHHQPNGSDTRNLDPVVAKSQSKRHDSCTDAVVVAKCQQRVAASAPTLSRSTHILRRPPTQDWRHLAPHTRHCDCLSRLVRNPSGWHSSCHAPSKRSRHGRTDV